MTWFSGVLFISAKVSCLLFLPWAFLSLCLFWTICKNGPQDSVSTTQSWNASQSGWPASTLLTPRDPLKGRPTFLSGIAHDDLASPLAGLLHWQRCAQALLVLPKTLAFPEAVLLHDFMCYCATVGRKKRKVLALNVISYSINWILHHSNLLLERESVNSTRASMRPHIITNGPWDGSRGMFRRKMKSECWNPGHPEITPEIRETLVPLVRFPQGLLENTRLPVCSSICSATGLITSLF